MDLFSYLLPLPSPICKSSRISKPLSHLNDYICNFTNHWCNLVQHDQLPAHHLALLANHSLYKEPSSYKEASTDPLWLKAMHKELLALNKNSTWDLVTLPLGKKAIGCKWVYRIRLNANGYLERFKARLVAKG